MYAKILFVLMHVSATFQRAMVISFFGEKDQFVVIYLEEITVFSNSYEEHLQRLKQTFDKCRNFGLSLNPKKSQFSLRERNLFGVVSLKIGGEN